MDISWREFISLAQRIKFLLKAFLVTYTTLIALLIFLTGNLVYIILQAPSSDKLTEITVNSVGLDDMPAHVSAAFLAAEDIRFHDRPGMETRAIIKSLVRAALQKNDIPQEITLVQKLVKYAFEDDKDTFARNLQEAYLAFYLQNTHNRKQILQMYVNHTSFGQNLYGISNASYHYFGKRPQDVTIGEAALLAAIAKSPQGFSRTMDLKNASAARNKILSDMQKGGLLGNKAYLTAQKENLILNQSLDQPAKAYEVNY